MDKQASSVRIREALHHLKRLLEGSCTAPEPRRWVGKLTENLEELERALADEACLKAQFFEETSQAHPRLIPTCAEFYENGRQLLLQATVVVRRSAQGHEDVFLPTAQLREATASLIDAIERHQLLALDITVEAGHDIGGQG